MSAPKEKENSLVDGRSLYWEAFEEARSFTESLPKESRCWKLIEDCAQGAAAQVDFGGSPMENAAFWFASNVEPLFMYLKQPPQEKITFKSDTEIYFAAMLQSDNLLPARLSSALALTLLDTIEEVGAKKLTINALHATPPPSGRRKGSGVSFSAIYRRYNELIRTGITKTKAYSIIGEEQYRSPDTIRKPIEKYIRTTEAQRSLRVFIISRCRIIRGAKSEEEKEALKQELRNELIDIEKKQPPPYYRALDHYRDRFLIGELLKKRRSNGQAFKSNEDFYLSLIEKGINRKLR